MDARRRPDNLRQFELGYTSDYSREPLFVSPRFVVPILHQLVDIASGVDYLHTLGVVHGNLKGVSAHVRVPISRPYESP